MEPVLLTLIDAFLGEITWLIHDTSLTNLHGINVYKCREDIKNIEVMYKVKQSILRLWTYYLILNDF